MYGAHHPTLSYPNQPASGYSYNGIDYPNTMASQGPPAATGQPLWPTDPSTNLPPRDTSAPDSLQASGGGSSVTDRRNPTLKSRSNRTPAPKSSQKCTIEEFKAMVHQPEIHKKRILEYTGSDSTYALAAKHARQMVQGLSDVPNGSAATPAGVHEATVPLTAVNSFLTYLLNDNSIERGARGCLALRISYSALTALMGEFSQGEALDTPGIFPQVCLPVFRKYNPSLAYPVACLSEKLQRCIKLYCYRRSPSKSMVTNFEGMIRTLNVWDEALGDGTFRGPTTAITNWLNSHPGKVIYTHQLGLAVAGAQREQVISNVPETPQSLPHPGSFTFLSLPVAYSLAPTTLGAYNSQSSDSPDELYDPMATGSNLSGHFDTPGPPMTYSSSSLPVGTSTIPYPSCSSSNIHTPNFMFQSPGQGSASQGPYSSGRGHAHY